MKTILSLITAFLVLMAYAGDSNLFAQDSTRTQLKPKYKNQIKKQKGAQVKAKQGKKFVDENKDGINDNAPDHDGDGIPNGKDEDYQGAKNRKGNSKAGFVDEDGDGVNDNALDDDGDGIPNGQDPDYVRPEDGSGKKNRKLIKTKNEIGKEEAPKSPTNTKLKK